MITISPLMNQKNYKAWRPGQYAHVGTPCLFTCSISLLYYLNTHTNTHNYICCLSGLLFKERWKCQLHLACRIASATEWVTPLPPVTLVIQSQSTLHHFVWVYLPVHGSPPYVGDLAILLARPFRPTVQSLTIAPTHGAQLDHLPHLQLALILTKN